MLWGQGRGYGWRMFVEGVKHGVASSGVSDCFYEYVYN